MELCKTLRNFKVLQCTSKYFNVRQSTSKYLELLQATSRYFKVLQGTSMYKEDQGRSWQTMKNHGRPNDADDIWCSWCIWHRWCRWCRWKWLKVVISGWNWLKVVENISGGTRISDAVVVQSLSPPDRWNVSSEKQSQTRRQHIWKCHSEQNEIQGKCEMIDSLQVRKSINVICLYKSTNLTRIWYFHT